MKAGHTTFLWRQMSLLCYRQAQVSSSSESVSLSREKNRIMMMGMIKRFCSNSRSKRTPASQKIYTKTGDKGTTALFTGERRPKYDDAFEALGSTDELSSIMGLAMAHAEDAGLDFVTELENVQCILQDIGSVLATPESSARDSHKMRVQFSDEYVQVLEKKIDEMTEVLPPLTNFILPSGSKTIAALHMTRSSCRRAERRVAKLSNTDVIDKRALVYLNRLSDYLFTLARYAAWKEGKLEKIYRRPSAL